MQSVAASTAAAPSGPAPSAGAKIRIASIDALRGLVMFLMVAEVMRLIRQSEYKRRQLPPGLKITGKAFGTGRRYPIAQAFRG